MKVFVGLSHKGGTGRSVTIANLAYRVAVRGKNVCVVDFDLASPTMGSVLGLPGLSVGVNPANSGPPRSIGDLLRTYHSAAQAHKAAVDIWGNPALDRKPEYGAFALIPGERYLGDNISPSEIKQFVSSILYDLSLTYDVVFLDIRSGISNVLSGLAQANTGCSTAGNTLIDGWLVHFRWTEQHLYGVADLLGNAQDGRGLTQQDTKESRIYMIRTAYIDPELIQGAAQDWFIKRNNDLKKKMDDLLTSQVQLIGSVPLDPLLQWRECIITSDLIGAGIANKTTDIAFSAISEKLISEH